MTNLITETKEQIEENAHYKKFIISGLVILVVCILAAGTLYKRSHTEPQLTKDPTDQEVSMDEPIDIVLDFYGTWLEAVKSTSTDPYTSGFTATKILSEKLRMQLMSTQGHAETEIDPVLCQTTTPERVSGKIVFQQPDVSSVLVTAKETGLSAQSVFTLKRHNDGWFIDDIVCASGELELPREFSFEKEGFLLKNVPPPLDSQYWHIVFEENGEKGHAVPLLFDAESSCVAIDGSKTNCDPTQFIEATKVHVYSQMTELGADVTRLEFVE